MAFQQNSESCKNLFFTLKTLFYDKKLFNGFFRKKSPASLIKQTAWESRLTAFKNLQVNNMSVKKILNFAGETSLLNSEQNKPFFLFQKSAINGELLKKLSNKKIKKTGLYSPKSSQIILTNIDQLTITTDSKKLFLKIGQFLRYGNEITKNIVIPESGQIIGIDFNKIILRKAKSVLFSSEGLFSLKNGQFVERNFPLFTLSYKRLKTEDIVQGIPKIEQIFEARQSSTGGIIQESLQDKLDCIFSVYKDQMSLDKAVRKSLEWLQEIIVDNVQQVYQSQDVFISEKHLEIIVRQMASKVKILEGGHTRLLRGELKNLDWIEFINKVTLGKKANYEPVILGITKASLEAQSFLSAASFQQTTRVLGRAAIERKTDYLSGLKENLILGRLIPAGTGYYPNLQSNFLDPIQVILNHKKQKVSLYALNFFEKLIYEK
jgi:DNA-directed RNA polymerase beta' subunit